MDGGVREGNGWRSEGGEWMEDEVGLRKEEQVRGTLAMGVVPM